MCVGAIFRPFGFWTLIFACDDSAADKQKHGATRKDRDSILSAILNEAAIVCYFSLM